MEDTRKPSALERLARKLEPSDKELKDAGKLPEHSRAAKKLKQAKDIDGIELRKPGETGPVKPVARILLDKTPMVFFNDGSLRHAMHRKPIGVSGRQWKKARKRARRLIKEAGE